MECKCTSAKFTPTVLVSGVLPFLPLPDFLLSLLSLDFLEPLELLEPFESFLLAFSFFLSPFFSFTSFSSETCGAFGLKWEFVTPVNVKISFSWYVEIGQAILQVLTPGYSKLSTFTIAIKCRNSEGSPSRQALSLLLLVVAVEFLALSPLSFFPAALLPLFFSGALPGCEASY